MDKFEKNRQERRIEEYEVLTKALKETHEALNVFNSSTQGPLTTPFIVPPHSDARTVEAVRIFFSKTEIGGHEVELLVQDIHMPAHLFRKFMVEFLVERRDTLTKQIEEI